MMHQSLLADDVKPFILTGAYDVKALITSLITDIFTKLDVTSLWHLLFDGNG